MPERCFLALASDEATIACLADVRRAFVEEAPAWRGEKWVAPELQHVTVKFIGAIPDDRVDAAIGAVTAAVSGIGPVMLVPSRLKAMPSARRATMVWATLDGDLDAAAALHDRVDEVLAAGFEIARDGRRFAPHLTLVRARSPRRVHHPALEAAQAVLDACGKDPVGFVSVPALTLIASTLGPGGPHYRVLAEMPL